MFFLATASFILSGMLLGLVPVSLSYRKLRVLLLTLIVLSTGLGFVGASSYISDFENILSRCIIELGVDETLCRALLK